MTFDPLNRAIGIMRSFGCVSQALDDQLLAAKTEINVRNHLRVLVREYNGIYPPGQMGGMSKQWCKTAAILGITGLNTCVSYWESQKVTAVLVFVSASRVFGCVYNYTLMQYVEQTLNRLDQEHPLEIHVPVAPHVTENGSGAG